MTADQWTQVILELSGAAGAVFYNTRKRKKVSETQCEAEEEQVSRIEAEAALTRTELRETRDAIVRLEVRIEASEKISEQHRVQMHALAGRVDASNAIYQEILQKSRDRQQSSPMTMESGNPKDMVDQTKLTVKKETKL